MKYFSVLNIGNTHTQVAVGYADKKISSFVYMPNGIRARKGFGPYTPNISGFSADDTGVTYYNTSLKK